MEWETTTAMRPRGVAAGAGKETGMGGLTRRSVLRSSLALGAVGILVRPYIANAAATTAMTRKTEQATDH